MDIAVPSDHKIKLRENVKKNKCIDIARELKKLWNVRVAFIITIISALGTVTEG